MEIDLKGQIGELIERGARPVSFGEASERHAAAGSAFWRERRQRWRVPRRVLIGRVTAGVAVAGFAAAVIVAPAHSGGPARQGATFVTVAMVQHLATASQSALASSGQERIRYRSVKNGAVTQYGTDIVTFSGSNYNYAVDATMPGSGAQPAKVITGSARVVNGQYYLQVDSTHPDVPWLHMLKSGSSAHFPKPGTVLSMLSPSAKFQAVGWEVIGGIRLEHLQATQVSGLPENLTLSRYADAGESLTALDLWANKGGVVHQMHMKLTGAGGATTLTIIFSDFGQPEVISTPAKSTPIS